MAIARPNEERTQEIFDKFCSNVEEHDNIWRTSSNQDWVSKSQFDHLWSKAEKIEHKERVAKFNRSKQSKASSEAYQKAKGGV